MVAAVVHKVLVVVVKVLDGVAVIAALKMMIAMAVLQ